MAGITVDAYAKKLFRDYLERTGRSAGRIPPFEREMLMERFENEARVYVRSLRKAKARAYAPETYLTEAQARDFYSQERQERPRPDRAEYLPEYDAMLQKREQQRALQAQKMRELQKQLEWEMSREGQKIMAAREARQRQERVAHLESGFKPAQYPTRRLVAGDANIRIDPALRYRGR